MDNFGLAVCSTCQILIFNLIRQIRDFVDYYFPCFFNWVKRSFSMPIGEEPFDLPSL